MYHLQIRYSFQMHWPLGFRTPLIMLHWELKGIGKLLQIFLFMPKRNLINQLIMHKHLFSHIRQACIFITKVSKHFYTCSLSGMPFQINCIKMKFLGIMPCAGQPYRVPVKKCFAVFNGVIKDYL